MTRCRMEYQVVTANDTRDLEVLVQALLDEGFEVQGGIAVAGYEYEIYGKGRTETGQTFAQALVRRTADAEPTEEASRP